MKRDGACKSAWQHSMPDYEPAVTQIPSNKIFDVLVAGGGITGLTTALLLQKAGKQCILAEAHNIGFGTTGGTTAHINTLLDHPYNEIKSKFGEKNAQLLSQATRQAVQLIKSNIKEYNIECGFSELPGYLYSQNEKQSKELENILEASREAGIGISYVDQIPVPIPFEKAVMFSGQAKFHPIEYIYSIAKAFEEAGGILLQNCRVQNIEEKDVIYTETSIGIIKTKQLIYATHIPPGVNLIHFRCAPYRSYAMAIQLKDDNYPNGLAYDMYDPYHYYRTQNIKGKNYLIAGGEDHKTAHEENTENCFRKLEAYIRKYFAVEEISFRWSSQYFEPADGLPYIGHLPGHDENIFVATGFGGNGITCGTISSFVLRDMIVTGTSEYEKLFDPNRIKPMAGFKKFVKENVDVVGQFVGKWFAVSDMENLAELSPGEAKLVKYEGEKIALYKDEKGAIHAVNPTCPHVKCAVAWNTAEKSWDCPCHGSRFSADGELWTGPSRSDLEKIELKDLVHE